MNNKKIICIYCNKEIIDTSFITFNGNIKYISNDKQEIQIKQNNAYYHKTCFLYSIDKFYNELQEKELKEISSK